MISIWQILSRFAAARPAVNDNAATEAGFPAAGGRVGADPYLTDAREARRLMRDVRLVSSVDGNPAAVLNMMALRSRRAA